MDRDEIRERFVRGASLVDPLYLFESVHDPRALASSLIEKCERLAGPGLDEFYSWLSRIPKEDCSFCFFGSSLVVRDPHDIDLMALKDAAGPLLFHKPSFIHVFETKRLGNGFAKNYGSFFLGSLLFPHPPPEYAQNAIDYCRETAFASPFFSGGYGEPLTHAAYRAIGSESLFEPEDWERVRHMTRFKVEYAYIDGGNMQTVPYSLPEVHDQIRKRLCLLEEDEMRALAKAATRRLGIKAEHREALADRFTRELKKLRR